MSRLRPIGGIASLALLLTACDASAFPSADRAASDGVVVSSPPTVLDFVDPARVPGLGTETIARDSPHVHVTYPTLADAPALGRGLRTWLSREVRAHVAAGPKSSAPTEFNVDWRLTAASGDIVGVRLRLGEFSGDGWADGFRTFWYDRADGGLHPSADLVNPDAIAELAAITRRLATAGRTGVAAHLIRADPVLFDSLNFNRHGDLVVELDDGRIVPATLGRAAVAIPAADAAPLLSDLGRRVQAIVQAAAPRLTAPPPEARQFKETGPEQAGPEQTAPRTTAPEQAGTGQAGTGQPGTGQPGTGQPGTGQPGTGQPGTGQPGTGQPGTGRSTADESGIRGPGNADASPTDCAKARCVALAFDDGPGPYTAEIIEIMGRHRACGTFFTVGLNAAAQPGLVRRVHDGCGLVATHTWSHRNLTTLPHSGIVDQIKRGRYAVTAATGSVPTLLLPPYGAGDEKVAAAARELGMTIVRAEANAGDGEDPAAVAAAVLARARRNAIILMHETQATVRALPRILKDLDRLGYVVVTIPDLGI